MYDVIIKNGTVIDGTGARMFRADVGVKEDRIAAIGNLHHDMARKVVDATDRYVAPGFIDVDNHSDSYWRIFTDPDLESLVYQGITTVVGGNCGSSLAPLTDASMLQSIQKWTDISKSNINWLTMKDFLDEIEKHHLAVNFATLSGHGTMRRGFLKDADRPLEESELDSMLALLQRSMKEGSFGCSLGLEYAHARHASESEMLSIGKIVKKQKGVCVVHLRNEADRFIESIEEMLHFAHNAQCSLHLSHLKVTGKASWHLMEKALYLIESAQSSGIDVSFDVYPYTSTGTVLYTLLPNWLSDNGRHMLLERLKDPGIRHELIIELREAQYDYSRMVILVSPLNQLLVRHNIAEIATQQRISPEEAVLYVLSASEGRAVVSMEVVSEENIEKAIQNPFSIISTNGAGYNALIESAKEHAHPRSFGTFPLVLSRFVREKKLLSWEEAIFKMSGKPAQKFGIEKRGVLRAGNYADIVVFHPLSVAASATLEDPYQYARGMEWVFTNGEATIENSVYTAHRSGEVLRKESVWF